MFLKNQSCIFIHVNICTSAKKINNTFNQKAMKNSRILKMIFYFIFITAISSCISDDEEINQGDELLGSWELSSSNDSSNYGIDFMPDNSGGWGGVTMYPDGTGIGFYEGFNWSTTDNPKTLIIWDDFDPNSRERLNSPYYINDDGQLIINNLQNGLPFNKHD